MLRDQAAAAAGSRPAERPARDGARGSARAAGHASSCRCAAPAATTIRPITSGSRSSPRRTCARARRRGPSRADRGAARTAGCHAQRDDRRCRRRTRPIAASALTEHFDVVLDLMADILLNPTFPEQEFDRYKTQTRAQLHAAARAARLPRAASASAWSWPAIIPTAASRRRWQSLDKTTRDDARRRSTSALRARSRGDRHRRRHLDGRGDDQASRRASAAWKKAGTPAPTVADPAALQQAGRLPGRAARTRCRPTCSSARRRFSRTDPDYYALTVMNKVIGGGPTGRLFRHLREEKGYTYGAGSQHRCAALPRHVGRRAPTCAPKSPSRR